MTLYKSTKVHLGQGQDLMMSIQIYFKYKYTYENAGFCILCIEILYRNFPWFSPRNVTGANPPPTSICDASLNFMSCNTYLRLDSVYLTRRDMSDQINIINKLGSSKLWIAASKEYFLPSFLKGMCDKYECAPDSKKLIPVKVTV